VTERARIWYFADPMCSWCWGFAPVLRSLRDRYGDRIDLALVLGGLRPGTTTPLPAAQREEILHHWQAVHARSGQPFRFEGALPEGFIYDTEPACRAVVTVGALRPERMLDFFESVQQAFYAEGLDVTQEVTLAALAARQGLDPAEFGEYFGSAATRAATQDHFALARKAGVRGFPTTIWQEESRTELLAGGWLPWEELEPQIAVRLGDREAEGGATPGA